MRFVVMGHRRTGELAGLPVPVAILPVLVTGEEVSSVGAETNGKQAPEVARMRQGRRQGAPCRQVPDLNVILNECRGREQPAVSRKGKTVILRTVHTRTPRWKAQPTRVGVTNVKRGGKVEGTAKGDKRLAVRGVLYSSCAARRRRRQAFVT